MSLADDWRADPLLSALACMALEPGLSGLLLFDATTARALTAARILARMREVVAKRPPAVALLPSSAGEEEIWGTPCLAVAGNAPLPRRRVLSPQILGAAGQVVVVPDLARIGLAGARALVTHAGADVAVLERDGESAAWHPHAWWIATLARGEVGEVSPHLLDRFALRVTVTWEPATDRGAEILAWAMAGEALHASTLPGLSPELAGRLRSAPPWAPEVPPDVLSQLLACFPALETPGTRRPLALTRFARAWAWLHGEARVTGGHVAEVARLAGLVPPAPAEPGTAPAEPPSATADEPPEPQTAEPAAKVSVPADTGGTAMAEASAASHGPPQEPAPGDEQAFPSAVLAPPYPEDTAPTAREAFSLQLPPIRGRDSAANAGVPIGTRRVHEVRDIAVVSTVLEAAKFRRVRPALHGGGGGIRVTLADLRGYRRVPVPQQVLALVLDYTSLGDTLWQDALLPHLQWAYVSRASVLLVQVGARSAPEPLRATQIAARNLLSPLVRAAFDEGPGTATPLAHGLDLAVRSLRRAFTQGRARVRGGVLVVVTDGRGNVPLEVSLAGTLRGRVMRQGVDDALAVSRPLAALKELTRVVLHPAPQQYPRLPLELAEAMGATAQAMELARPVVEAA